MLFATKLIARSWSAKLVIKDLLSITKLDWKTVQEERCMLITCSRHYKFSEAHCHHETGSKSWNLVFIRFQDRK